MKLLLTRENSTIRQAQYQFFCLNNYSIKLGPLNVPWSFALCVGLLKSIFVVVLMNSTILTVS